jgi:hypothetical protein
LKAIFSFNRSCILCNLPDYLFYSLITVKNIRVPRPLKL